MRKEELKRVIEKFPKTNVYYKHKSGRFFYTNGIQYLIDHAPCNWLFDQISELFLIQDDFMKIDNPFTLRLTRGAHDPNVLMVIHNSRDEFLYSKAIINRTLPFSVTLKMINHILLLPSEGNPD